MTTPRAPLLISASRLRAWLGGISGAQVRRLRKSGRLPDPLPGTRLYDFAAVKRALDGRSDPGATISEAEAKLIERAEQWGNRS